MDSGSLIGAGMGLGLVGAGLSAYGQGQAAKRMAGVQGQRLRTMHDIQQRSLKDVSNEITRSNPAAQLAGAEQVPNAAMQSELAKLGAAGAVQGNAGAGQQSALNAVAQHAALQNRIAAPELAIQSQQSKLAALANQQSALQAEADQQNALYDMDMSSASRAGIGARGMGSILGFGGAGLSTLGMMGVGSQQPSQAATPKKSYGYTNYNNPAAGRAMF